MAGLLFVSQSVLDSWTGQGKIDFAGSVMTILSGAGRGRSYRLEPAVRFLKVVGADVDPHGLLHKVKSEAQLREQGAEVLGASVILGDVGYEVDPGFLAEMAALQAAAASVIEQARTPTPPAAAEPPGEAGSKTSTPPGGQRLPKDLEERRKEAEALARFLLDNLS